MCTCTFWQFHKQKCITNYLANQHCMLFICYGCVAFVVINKPLAFPTYSMLTFMDRRHTSNFSISINFGRCTCLWLAFGEHINAIETQWQQSFDIFCYSVQNNFQFILSLWVRRLNCTIVFVLVSCVHHLSASSQFFEFYFPQRITRVERSQWRLFRPISGKEAPCWRGEDQPEQQRRQLLRGKWNFSHCY